MNAQLSALPRTSPPRALLVTRFREVRATTERLCAPLATEDYVVQSMPDASPAKWHLAHTTWFFETFILKPTGSGGSGADHANMPISLTPITTHSANESRARSAG